MIIFIRRASNGTPYREATSELRTGKDDPASAHSEFGASGNGFKAITVNHISYQEADYAKTRDFYADLLGMKVSQDDGKQCFLSFGDTFSIPRNRPTGTPRIDHIAYTIDNWNRVRWKLS